MGVNNNGVEFSSTTLAKFICSCKVIPNVCEIDIDQSSHGHRHELIIDIH